MSDEIIINTDGGESAPAVGETVSDAVEIAETIVETAREMSRDNDDTGNEYERIHDELARQGAASADFAREVITRLDTIQETQRMLGEMLVIAQDAIEETLDEVVDEVVDDAGDVEQIVDDAVEQIVDETEQVIDDAPEQRRQRKRRFI